MEALAHASAPEDAKVLDAHTLGPDEVLDGRDLRGFRLTGDFSHRRMVGVILAEAVLDDCILRHAVLRCADLRGASLKYVDARRADLRGASLVGACIEGARLCRVNLRFARLAGMWGGPRDTYTL